MKTYSKKQKKQNGLRQKLRVHTLGEEAATTLGGAAGLPAMVPRTQLTTVDSETVFTAPDIGAEDLKAAAADIADGSSAVDLTAGATPTEAGNE